MLNQSQTAITLLSISVTLMFSVSIGGAGIAASPETGTTDFRQLTKIYSDSINQLYLEIDSLTLRIEENSMTLRDRTATLEKEVSDLKKKIADTNKDISRKEDKLNADTESNRRFYVFFSKERNRKLSEESANMDYLLKNSQWKDIDMPALLYLKEGLSATDIPSDLVEMRKRVDQAIEDKAMMEEIQGLLNEPLDWQKALPLLDRLAARMSSWPAQQEAEARDLGGITYYYPKCWEAFVALTDSVAEVKGENAAASGERGYAVNSPEFKEHRKKVNEVIDNFQATELYRDYFYVIPYIDRLFKKYKEIALHNPYVAQNEEKEIVEQLKTLNKK